MIFDVLIVSLLTLIGVLLLIRTLRRVRTAEDSLRVVTENIPEHIAVFDHKWCYRFCNTRYARMFGVDVHDIVGKHISEVVGDEAFREVMPKFNAAFSGHPVTYERELQLSGGECRFIEATLLPQPVAGRTEVWVVAHDITARKQVELELRAAYERLELALEASEVSLWEWNRERGTVYLAKEWAKIIGAEVRDTYSTVDAILADVHPDDLARIKAVLHDCVYGANSQYAEQRRVRTLRGDWRWVLSRGKVIERDADGVATRLSGSQIDITAHKEAERLIAGQKQVLELIASGAALGVTLNALTSTIEALYPGMLCSVLLTDKSGSRLYCGAARSLPDEYNRAIEGIAIGPNVGSCGTAVYRRERVVVEDIASDPLWADFRDIALRNNLRACWSQPVMSLTGTVLGTFAMYYAQVRAPGERELRVVEAAAALAGIAIARKRDEERLSFLAQYDTLTGLPNRNLLRDRLGQSIARANRENCSVALVFLDLDRFKEINDTLGHAAGDRVLQVIADRLRGCLREQDTIARLGGDEFTLIVEDIANQHEVHQIAQKILAVFTQPVAMDGADLFITPSMGIALYPVDGSDVESLLKHADMAMYHAKGKGRNNYQFYASTMSVDASARMSVESNLRHAVEREELVLYYQPVVDIGSQRIVGAEALLRWRHPHWGLVAPDRFMQVAEQTGLIVPIGEWVIDQACAQATQWSGSGLPIPISVNLSARQFRKEGLAAMISAALRRHGLRGELLKLEITESLLMDSPALSRTVLESLKALGIGIALDDFGTGYSSLSYLKHFPLDILKIDQSFVSGVVDDADDAAIVKAMIGMAHNLQLKLTGEGVETGAQLDFLRKHDCDFAQGYLFSRPVDCDAFMQLLASSLGVQASSLLRARG